MNVSSYRLLSKDERLLLISEDNFLATRKDSGVDISLFAVADFFVEIKYLPGSKIPIDVYPITRLKELEVYMDPFELPLFQ